MLLNFTAGKLNKCKVTNNELKVVFDPTKKASFNKLICALGEIINPGDVEVALDYIFNADNDWWRKARGRGKWKYTASGGFLMTESVRVKKVTIR